jgi:hypothetical protein
MAITRCSNCGAQSSLTLVCPTCGAFRISSMLLSLVFLGASWGSFSLFTFNLISVTFAFPIPAPSPTPTPLSHPGPLGGYVAPPQPQKPPEVLMANYIPYAQDREGKKASFLIHLLTDEYRWKLSRWDLLEDLQSEINFSSSMRKLMNSAIEIVCIGASSEEIEDGLSYNHGRQKEEWRAGRRAESISKWVRAVLQNPVNVRKLNIGHRDQTLETNGISDTSDQRRIIIVLVLKAEDGVNMDQALRDAFQQERNKQPIYETILTRYSLTQTLNFRWEE